MILKPVPVTVEELRSTREELRSNLRSVGLGATFFVIVFGSLQAYRFTHKGEFGMDLMLLPIACLIAALIWHPYRLLKQPPTERRFYVLAHGLEIQTMFPDELSVKVLIRWKDVLFSERTAEGVELRMRSGGSNHLPRACFESEDQIDEFLALTDRGRRR